MGNTSKGFKSEGHVLGTAPPPPRSSIKTESIKTKTTTKPTTTKPIKLTPEEAEARRKKIAEAAAARERAWDERVNRQRAKRATETLPSSSSQLPTSNEPLSGPRGPLVAVDPAVAKALDLDAKKLETLENQGFNPYQSRIESATAARSAIVLDQQPQQRQTDDSVYLMTKARKDLIAAMHVENSTPERLKMCLEVAKAYDVPEVDEAEELLAALELQSYEEVDVSWQLLVHQQKNKTENESMATTMKTLEKLMVNLYENPLEIKFRTIRLENKVINTTVVSPWNGAALGVLESVGFERDGDVMNVPDPEYIPEEVVSQARVRIKRVIDLCRQWMKENN